MQFYAQMLTTEEAARFMGIASSTLRKYVKEKRLPAKLTFGGHYRFAIEDLEFFINGPEQKPGQIND